MFRNTMIITWIEIKSYLRDMMAIFWTFAYPAILLVILNLMFGSSQAGGGYSAYLISGLTAMSVVTVALFGFGVVLVTLRDDGRLKLFEVMPVSKVSYLMGFAFSRVLLITIFSLLFVVIADWVYDSKLHLGIVPLLNFSLFITLGGFSFISVGFIVISFISKPSTAAAFFNIMAIPVLFLSDLFIPITVMPENIQSIVSVTPVYLFVDGCRDILVHGASMVEAKGTLLMLLVLGVVSYPIASIRFKLTPAVT